MMFCHKCGTKAIEGAGFCQKCGAKLIRDEETQSGPEPMSEPIPKPAETPTLPVEPVSPPIETPPQPEQIPEQTLPPKDAYQQAKEHADNDNNINGNNTDIYALLKENIGMCSVLKSAKRTKKGIRLCGKTYRYTVKANTAQVKIRSVLSFPLSTLYWVLAGVLGSTAGLILQELIKYRDGIYLEYYHYALFALCCLVVGAVMLIHSFVRQREKKAVADYVREIVEPKQIYLVERKQPGLFKVRTAVAAIGVVAGIIVLIFNFPMPLKYPNELLFDGVPIEQFLEMTKENIEAEFGEADPTYQYQNTITGDDIYRYDSVGNDKSFPHVVYSKETGKVIYIEFWGSDCSYNRQKLDKPWYRVDDILQERSRSGGKFYMPNLYMYGTYGSVHTGFKYSDGVYFGDTLEVEEALAREELKDTDDKFSDVRVYEEGIADESGMIPLELKDYRISLIYPVWSGYPNASLARVCLYADEWVEAMNEEAYGLSSNNAELYEEEAYGSSSDNTELYGGAYAKKVRELAAEDSDLQFALIDLTRNNVPELVAELSGYYVRVFAWIDGEVVPLGDEYWPYGAGGNNGYEYLPGQNVIRNFNSDQAGAIVYESYYGINFANEVDSLPIEQLSMWYFRDTNGNGLIDENEPFYDEPIYYVGNTEVSADIYAGYQIPGDYEWIAGSETAEVMLAKLNSKQSEDLHFVKSDDEYSTFTLHPDGTFSMEVNLFAGVGTLFGSYTMDEYSVQCYIESRSFEGFDGDDVTEFEMVFNEDRLVYVGASIGAVWDGSTFNMI